jgi:hypothetical protein
MFNSRELSAFESLQIFNNSLFTNFTIMNVSLMTMNSIQTNKETFNETIYKIDSWLTICLSIVSCILIIVFLVAHIVGQIERRDRAKETKKSAFKKLIRIEYLVIAYCIVLFLAHFCTLIQKLFIQLVLNNFLVTNRRRICLIMAALKQFFWLLSVIHTNALSVKIYQKFTKSIDTNVLNQKSCIKAALNVFLSIYLVTFIIIFISLAVHFFRQDVYKLDFTDKMNCCFLNYPLFVILFFALPITSILIVNLVLFIILFKKTKSTLNQSENNETSYFFFKLAVLMGFSWIVYIICVSIMEAYSENFHMQIIIVIGSCQINFQGSLVVICTYSSSILESLSKKKTKNKRVRVVRFNLHLNRPIYDNRMTAL